MYALNDTLTILDVYKRMRKSYPKLAFEGIVRKMKIYAEYTDDPERIPTKIRATVLKAIFRKEGISVFESNMMKQYGLNICSVR